MRISDWSSDVCSSDLLLREPLAADHRAAIGMEHLARHIARILAGQEQEARRYFVGLARPPHRRVLPEILHLLGCGAAERVERRPDWPGREDRKSTRLNSSH